MDDGHLLNAFAGPKLLCHTSYTPTSDLVINYESVATFPDHNSVSLPSPPTLHLDCNSASQATSLFHSMVNTGHAVPKRQRILRHISNMVVHGWKKDTDPSSSTVVQDKETKLEGHRLAISIHRLAKSILNYVRSPVWKCVGPTILPTMEEYRRAWVDLLQALISNIEISRRYMCFLSLLPRAMAQDLKSILNNFRKDIDGSERFSLRSSWRRLWRSPELNFYEIGREFNDRKFKRLYDTNIDMEKILVIGLSNIQYFATHLPSRPNAPWRSNEKSRADLPLALQVENVKDVLHAMNAARHTLGKSLEIADF